MTNREKEILDIIRQNPMIQQNEIAELLDITRSSVAVHITNLIKKGYVMGKGYVLKDESYILVIGGANMDIQGKPETLLNMNDSNPGVVSISAGGVGRNIAENLSRMGARTQLITALGNDSNGKRLMQECVEAGIDMHLSTIFEDSSTSTYLSILDETGDMKVAIAHMDVFKKMTVNYIKKKHDAIKHASAILIDTNLPQETIEYLLNTYGDKPFFLDTVSTAKAKKVRDLMGKFHTIKPNKIEAEMLSGIAIKSAKDIEKAGAYFIDQGVKQVFISLGAEGLYYTNGAQKEFIKNPSVEIINATGAGDAFMAGLLFGYSQQYSIEETARFAMMASAIAINHENTINPNMSYDLIIERKKEFK